MAALLPTLRAAGRRLAAGHQRRRAGRSTVCVVGPGKHFLSGMTYHSFSLIAALDGHGPTSAILLRNLVPRRLYPGRDRVGADLSHLRLPPSVARAERVDWWWGPGMAEAAWGLLRRPPAVLVVQWWSAAVWHTELALIVLARLGGAKVVIEVHEVLDTAESRHRLAGTWVRHVAPLLLDRADRVIVHSDVDRRRAIKELGVAPHRIEVVLEPAFDTYDLGAPVAGRLVLVPDLPDGHRAAAVDARATELLFFGTIRPYKGLEHLVDAFDRLCAQHAEEGGPGWRLTVVGETWEGWDRPAHAIGRSPNRDRITFVNRYVPDEEVDRWFAAADLVVLPYLRSSASGPLMVAMSYGLPVVVTRVGGLPEAAAGYEGAVLVDPADPVALAEGIAKAEPLVGRRYYAPRDWSDVARAHEDLYRRLGVRGRT